MTTLHGLYVPMITPFDEGGEVALDALGTLAHQVLDDGATGLVALGTTGEPASLNPAERAAVLDLLTTVCRDRGAPLLAGANDAAALQALPPVTAALTLVLVISPMCARNSFTNSTPTAIFFQNLTTPSVELVIKKSVDAVKSTNASCSRCISDLE